VGYRRVTDGETVASAFPDATPGYVLARFAGKYGRPVALAFAGDTGRPVSDAHATGFGNVVSVSGQTVRLDKDVTDLIFTEG
jgi:hypothetical protein